LLRELIQDQEGPKIITQVLNSENQQLINQTDVDDFIISNRLITMVLAQLSEEPKIRLLYDDIFSEDGKEIYVKPAHLYFDSFPQEIAFGDAMKIANLREEVCLGIRKGNAIKDFNDNFGVRLNLPKNEKFTLEENDFLVVLSEDEL
jgi:beta-glucosidase-like glycosyl hydrolase